MTRFVRSALFATAALLVATTSCNDQPTAPRARAAQFKGAASNITTPSIVISQVYGGGGNAGATLKNDFIELFNPGTASVSLAGWSVQYQAAGTTTGTWTVTPIGGSIPAGGYYLVQEAAGTGGTVSLPTPETIGTIAMGAGNGKVALVSNTTALPGGCPTSSTIVDIVPYGSPSACTVVTPTLSNTTAAIRGGAGCTYTGSVSADFTAGAPAPRNSATPLHTCGGGGTIPLTGTGLASPSSLAAGSSSLLTVTLTSFGPGTTVSATADLSSIGGSSAQQMFDDGTNGDVTANDHVFSFPATVAIGTTTGSKTLSVALSDNEARTGSVTISLTVVVVATPADLVISQVYGGGGNSGSTLTNDFIEIFNRTNAPVSLGGWSVQQTSAAGTSWSVTLLTGSIPAHGYYLVQESANGGGTVPLPTPDASGGILMGATSGKVILATQTAAFSGACPTASTVIDRMGYGESTNSLACGTEWGGRTDDLSATNSAARLMSGCFNTTKSGFDFQVQTAAPRNSAAAPFTCPAPSAATIVVNEILAEPFHAAGGPSWGEWFEVKNTGATPVDLQGWTITTQGQAPHVISSSLVVPPGGMKVLGRGSDAALNGGITLDYNYFTSTPFAIFLDGRDFIMLTDGTGGLVDIARWTNSATIVLGSSLGLRDASADNMDVGGSNWGYSTVEFGDGDFGTPGADNGTLATSPLVFPNKLVVTGRFPSDPALPIGYEDQLFASEVIGATGDTIHPAITWTSLTPALASIDATTGLMHSIAPGSAQFRGTAPDGTTATVTLPMAFAQLGGTAHYGNNAEFGEPVDNDPSDDFIIRRDQYITSYNKNRNTPNWVAYNLEGSHIGSAVDRCDCFTMDPLLPADFLHINTNDYTGAGGVAGYGIDRGHMARSFDRTSGELDNAYTYLLSNVIPQAADLNQGPWAVFETFLGDKARFENKELYIIVGIAGSKGFIKDESKIVMPARVWKVAVIMPKDKGLADVHTYQDLEVIAINAPNDPGVRNTDWHDFVTTVDAIEALSGYNLLAALPDNIETAVESNTKPPIGVVNGPFASNEGSSVSMSGAGSFDPNGSIVSYAWNFGDGSPVAPGASASHTYAQDGVYTVTLTVTDNDGLTDVVMSTATVGNVAPAIAAFAGTTIPAGGAYSATGSFTDPGADSWSATVNYGDGSGVQSLALSGGTFSLSHTYASAGSFTVTVTVSDDDATSSRTASVGVLAYPVANAGGPYTVGQNMSLALNGAASNDPDGSIVSYAWDFGDGSTASGVSPTHTYVAAGSFTVTLTVTDNDGLTNSSTTTVNVLTPQQSLANISAAIDQLGLSSGNANSLKAKINAAIQQLNNGNRTPARNQLQALLNEINAKEQSGALSASDAAALRAAVLAVLGTL